MFRLRWMIALLALLFCLPALADHSPLPPETALNETQVLDLAVAQVCAEYRLTEADIRGQWHYSAHYQEAIPERKVPYWLFGYPGEAWIVCLDDPTDGSGVFEYRLTLDPESGACLVPVETRTWSPEDFDVPYLWLSPFVPRKDQLQPAAAEDAALEALADALEMTPSEVRSQFRECWRENAVTNAGGRFWYHIQFWCDSSLENPLFHMYMDADTGRILRQTDPRTAAGRWRQWQSGVPWDEWYDDQLARRIAEWGEEDCWDYEQHAAFMRQCCVIPMAGYATCDLPAPGESSLAEAVAAAQRWMAEAPYYSAAVWKLTGSVLEAWPYDDSALCLRAEDNFEDRRWVLTFVSDDPLAEEIHLFLDPATLAVRPVSE